MVFAGPVGGARNTSSYETSARAGRKGKADNRTLDVASLDDRKGVGAGQLTSPKQPFALPR